MTAPKKSSHASSAVGKIMYAALFCLLLPAALIAWAHFMPVSLPAVSLPLPGALLIACGLLLLIAGMLALRRQGGGLPMNAFPPSHYVTGGIYRVVRHPIYVGFCAVVFGASLVFASAAGLWVVAPLVACGSVALVLGYERHDLQNRFGSQPVVHRACLRLPADASDAPSPCDYVSIYVLVLAPWLILYECTSLLPAGTVNTLLPFERRWPVLEWTEAIYVSSYAVALLSPLSARRQRDLRSFAVEGLLATAVGMSCFITLPFIAPTRPFAPTTPLGHLLVLERTMDTATANAFPSFHALWALICARLMARRGRFFAVLGWTWALAVMVSCITTGMHSLADVAAASVVFIAVGLRGPIYRLLLRGSEMLGNSFRAWRIGPIRIINHAIFSGAAGFVGALIIGWLLGPAHLLPLVVVTLCSLTGGALWAQLIEGSPRLLRPFGYYGAILGGILGTLLGPLMGTSPWLLLAVFSVAAPFAQAIGRLRCIVQGCCHGKPCSADIGVRYHNPSTRVCKFTAFTNVPLHPTQLYSFLANLVAGPFLLRLYLGGASLNVITGVYLALAGLIRFVEESYRGEPQTRNVWGLPEYQWLAIASTVAGCVIMALPLQVFPPGPEWDIRELAVAGGIGVLYAAGMSADFPESNRRFARLTG